MLLPPGDDREDHRQRERAAIASAALPGGPPTAADANPNAASGAARGTPRLSSVRRAGARLRFSLSAQARVTVTARATHGRGRTIASEIVPAGAQQMNLALQRLALGRYRVTVRARGATGRTSNVSRLRVRVTRRLRLLAKRLRRVTNPTPPPAPAVNAAMTSKQAFQLN